MRRNYRKRFNRYKSGFRKMYNKAGINLTTEFLLGAAVGSLTDFDNKIPAPVKILTACAPVRGMGQIKGFAQGMLVGDILSAYVPKFGTNGNGYDTGAF